MTSTAAPKNNTHVCALYHWKHGVDHAFILITSPTSYVRTSLFLDLTTGCNVARITDHAADTAHVTRILDASNHWSRIA